MAEAEQLPLLGQLGERRLLVVAALGHPGERFVVEHVDAGVDPVRQARRLAKTCHAVVVAELDHAELRPERRDHDRRGAAVLFVRLQERAQVDVVQLVAVERIERARLLSMLCRKAQASPAPERLRLRDGDDRRTQPCELRLEQCRLPVATADDHALDACAHELRHLVLRDRMSRDRDERLRLSPGRVAEPRRLPPREDDRFH